MSEQRHDILVVGGGLTGLAFAALLRNLLAELRRDLSIAVLESGAPPAATPATEIGLRVIAVSPASHEMLERCGGWSGLPASRVGVYRRMVVWHGQYEARRRDSISFDAAEAGVRELGFIVENELLRAVLWRQVETRPGIGMLRGTPAQLIEEPDHLVVVLGNGDRVRTRLLVGADGTASWVREAVRVPLAQRSYGQMAIVAHVGSELPHGQTARQKFLPTGPVALLPLADGRSSVVWSCPEKLAAELLGLSGDQFADRLTGQTDRVLGRLKLESDRAAFPLRIAHSARYTGRRFALVGDAAHRVHPLAGLGVNLGFLDAAALAETLAEALAEHRGERWADPGDPRVLRRFERQRKGANLLALASLDMLNRLFTNSSPALEQIAAAGMSLVDRSGPVKRWLGAYAMGTQGNRQP